MNLHCYKIKLGGNLGKRGISIPNQPHKNGPSIWKDFIKVIPLHIKTRYQTAADGKRLRLNIERGWQRYVYWKIRWIFLPCVVISLFPKIMIWFYSHIYIILMSLLTAIYLDNHLQCLGSYGIFDFVTRFYPIDQIPGRFLVFFRSAVARGGICVLIPNRGLIVVTYLLEIKYIACLLFSSMKLDWYRSNQDVSAGALNTVKSLSDEKGILAHKMAGGYIIKSGGFSSKWRFFSTHTKIFDKYFF